MPSPEECFDKSSFGFGPFGDSTPCVPHPPGAGYGGVGYGLHVEGQGGPGYGLAGFGGSSHWPANPVAISGGYGGDPYGLGPYGSVEDVVPEITSVLSVSGWEVEVFFNEEMDPNDPALLDPDSYTFTPVIGAAPTTALEVEISGLDPLDLEEGDFYSGVTSVIVRHTGTTLGGTYQITVSGPTDLGGNQIIGAQANFLARGEAPSFSVAPTSGNTLLVEFDQAMLPVGDYPGGPSDNPRLTIEDTEEWLFEDNRNVVPVYPVGLTATEIVFPFENDYTKAQVTTLGQTSIDYKCRLSPSFVVDWDASQGDILSVDGETYQGVLVGAMTSAMVGGRLRYTRLAGLLGSSSLDLTDLTGKFATGATVRVDWEFEAQFVKPVGVLSPIINLLLGENDASETSVLLSWDGVGNGPVITVSTGPTGFTQDLTAYDWTDGTHIYSIVYNYKSEQVTFLFDNHPIYSTALANLRAPAVPYGDGIVSIALSSEDLASNLVVLLDRVHLTASSTVYSNAWNFLHEEEAEFEGSAELAQGSFKTQRGPLVKNHGDAAPASKQDVEVSVNGVSVEVESVNPYTGEVFLTIPVPRMPPGQIDVSVDYKWFSSPSMYIRGLNTKGLVLNKYNTPRGHHDPPSHGAQSQVLPNHPKGSVATSRFLYNALLGPPKHRPKPKLIAHRYIGFERAYSALLNSATSLRLNNHPHRYQVPGFDHPTNRVSIAYDGEVLPTDSGWSLTGSNSGGLNHGQGTFVVTDSQSGSFDPENPSAVIYHQDVDLSFPASLYIAGRFQVEDWQEDGVFTGVGFGFHDKTRLYLAGALLINGLQHVGLLLNPDQPHLVDSWQVGPQTTVSVQAGQVTCTAQTSSLPQDISVGDRFQVLTGSQEGIYTLTSVARQTDGTTVLGVTPPFPAFHDLWGNKYPQAFFEVLWGVSPATYRLTVDPGHTVVILQMSGDRTATIVEIAGDVPTIPTPAETSLLIPNITGPDTTTGSVFWGSLSRQATNETTWSFFRYGVVPDSSSVRGHTQTVTPDLSTTLPDEELSDPWYPMGTFGVSQTTAGKLLVKSTSNLEELGPKNAYARNEVFLVPQAGVDLRSVLRVESAENTGSSGASIANGARVATLANVLYASNSGHALVRMPTLSFSGIQNPVDQGWVLVGSVEPHVLQQSFVVTQNATMRGGWVGDLLLNGGDVALSSTGRVFETHFAVHDHTANLNGDTGIEFTAEVGPSPYKSITVTLRSGGTPGVRILSGNVVIDEFDFDWTDGELHLYRCVADVTGNTLVVYVDDILQTTVDLSLFVEPGSSNHFMSFGVFGTDIAGVVDTDITAVVEFRAGSMQSIPLAGVKRTLGVKLSDEDSINAWALPRTGNLSVPNSSSLATIVEWDWRSDTEFRFVLDPLWGASLLRPDLPLPVGYTGENASPASGFHTRKVEPSAAWINVEYGRLPRDNARFGHVAFGNFGGGVAQSRWTNLRYEIFKHWKDDIKQPGNMVLNKHNVVASDLGNDVTLEQVETETLDRKRLTLKPFHLYASRVYKVVDEALLVGQQIFTSEMWDFDHTSQTLTLKPDQHGVERNFSSVHARVTVVFVPGKPVTETYLKAQPVLDALTRLNEGTPPYPKSQVAQTVKKTAVANVLEDNDSVGALDPVNILEDSDRFLDHTTLSGSLYEQMSFFETDDGGQTGLIQWPCEATMVDGISGFTVEEGDLIYEVGGVGDSLGGAGHSANHTSTGERVGSPYGGYVQKYSGRLFTEQRVGLQADRFPQKGGLPRGYLYASGGSFAAPVINGSGSVVSGMVALGGTLAPGSAVLWPSYPAHAGVGRGGGKIYQRNTWRLRMSSVITSDENSQDLEETLTPIAGDELLVMDLII